MWWVLFFICCVGLAYCLLNIVFILASMAYMYRELRFLSKSFNSQYKVLRHFIKKDLTDIQIYDKLKKHRNARNKIFVGKNLYIYFEKNGGIICTDTAKVRESLLKAACLIHEIQTVFEKANFKFSKEIYFENDEFFKELQKICEEKGEPAFYKDVDYEKDEDYYEYDELYD